MLIVSFTFCLILLSKFYACYSVNTHMKKFIDDDMVIYTTMIINCRVLSIIIMIFIVFVYIL